MSDIIDQLLSDFSSPSNNPDVRQGLSRGQDFQDLSGAEDTGLLDEICPEGDHTQAQPGPVGLIAADQDWQGNGARPFTAEDSVMGDVLKQAGGDDEFRESEMGMPRMASADVKIRIKALLHLGYTPKRITAYLDKLAEMQLFDRTISDEFLKDQSGLMGLSYIEPNHFNQKSCVASLRKIKAEGKLRAASVKRIAACTGCDNCKKAPDGACKCAVYGLPIVSNEKQMASVVAKLSGGTMKKASLVMKHNGESSIATPGHQVNTIDRVGERRTDLKTASAMAGTLQVFDIQAMKEAAGGITPKTILASLGKGKSLPSIYDETKNRLGSVKAQKVVRTFLDSLKKTGARLNLASIDCDLLKRRLTASETIIGKSKCATCTLRMGMHCGQTGGTLVSFPGMETTGGKRASLKSPAQDGVEFMNQIELRGPTLVVPIGKDRDLLDIEMSSTPVMNW